MPEPDEDHGPTPGGFLGHKIGPLPIFGWVLLGGGAAFILWYLAHRGQSGGTALPGTGGSTSGGVSAGDLSGGIPSTSDALNQQVGTLNALLQQAVAGGSGLVPAVSQGVTAGVPAGSSAPYTAESLAQWVSSLPAGHAGPTPAESIGLGVFASPATANTPGGIIGRLPWNSPVTPIAGSSAVPGNGGNFLPINEPGGITGWVATQDLVPNFPSRSTAPQYRSLAGPALASTTGH